MYDSQTSILGTKLRSYMCIPFEKEVGTMTLSFYVCLFHFSNIYVLFIQRTERYLLGDVNYGYYTCKFET